MKSCMRALVRLAVPDLEEDIRAPNIREEEAKVREGRSQTWVEMMSSLPMGAGSPVLLGLGWQVTASCYNYQ